MKRNMFVPAMLITLLILWVAPALAQDTLWSRAYGWGGYSGHGHSVQQTMDGGYIIAGEEWSVSAYDYFHWPDLCLVRTNSAGDTLWSRSYGGEIGEEAEMGYSVQQTTDGGYIVAGMTASYGAGLADVYLLKTDSLGDTLWSRTYGGSGHDYGYSVQQTTDGGYIVAGYTGSFGSGAADVYLIKTDSLGNTLWSRAYGGSDDDYGYSVQQTTDGGYIVAGLTHSFGAGGGDVFVVKTHNNGGTLWSRTYGGSYEDRGSSVQQTTDGGYVVAGFTESHGPGDFDVYLIKTDSLGDTLWSRTYGGNDPDYGHSVQQTTDGGYIVAGQTYSFDADSADVFVVKTHENGDVFWSCFFGGSKEDLGSSVRETADGGYVVTGSAGIPSEMSIMLTKLDPLGRTCFGQSVSPTVLSLASTTTDLGRVDSSCSTIVTRPTGKVVHAEPQITTVCLAILGDANGDGVIDLGDAVQILNYLFKGGPAPDPLWTGDCNCDGMVDFGDAIYLLNYLFKGGPPPCEP
jgi:nicotinamide riboside kinase